MITFISNDDSIWKTIIKYKDEDTDEKFKFEEELILFCDGDLKELMDYILANVLEPIEQILIVAYDK